MSNRLFVFGCSYATGEELLLHELGYLDRYRIQTANDPRLFFKKLKETNSEHLYENVKRRQKEIAWPNLLAKKLNYECINLAKNGNSLDEITFQVLQQQSHIREKDLVIVSLTKSTRNAVFNKTVESFQLPSLVWPLKRLIGVKDIENSKYVINKQTDKALLDWFTDDRIAWDYLKNLKVLETTQAKCVLAMNNSLDTSFDLFKDLYKGIEENFLSKKGLDDFSINRHCWGHPEKEAHKKYAEHLYEILRKL